MVVLGNGGSYLGRSLQSVLLPYGNSIGINTPWNFFSPDPAHTMYIRAVIRYQDTDGTLIKDSAEFYLPKDKEKIVIDSGERRFLYAMRFLMISPLQIETILIPYLCKVYPGATSVYVEHLLEKIPPLDAAHFMTSYKRGEDNEDGGATGKINQAEGRCEVMP